MIRLEKGVYFGSVVKYASADDTLTKSIRYIQNTGEEELFSDLDKLHDVLWEIVKAINVINYYNKN